MTQDQAPKDAAKKPKVKVLGREDKPLPKRFYQEVGLGATVGGFAILLDGRPVRTPAKSAFVVPREALAAAVAEEWAGQVETINPHAMPLTRLCNTAIDRVRGRETEILDELTAYAGSDLVCYRADHPASLVSAQKAAWDPVLTWAETQLGVRLVTITGLMPVAQPPESLAHVRAALVPFDPFALCALHNMTTLTGSLLLPLGLARGPFDLDFVWAAAHIDDDHQIAAWGQDDEAAGRRAGRWLETQAAARLLQLVVTRS